MLPVINIVINHTNTTYLIAVKFFYYAKVSILNLTNNIIP